MRTFQDENPLIGQDPFIFQYDGEYHLIESWGEKAIVISTLSGLDNPYRVRQLIVWNSPNEHQVWAPEIHQIDGHWFIYYTASDGGNASHRTFVLGAASDPFGPYLFKEQVGPDIWGIDMTTFEHQGQRYAVWSGWEFEGEEFPQNLYIAKMNSPVDVGPRRLLARPVLDWQTSVRPILEGPQAFHEDGKLHLLYSANASWSQEYSMGALMLVGGDPISKNNWVMANYRLRNQGHGMIFDGGFAYHTKLSSFEGWEDRAIIIKEQ